MLTVMKCKQDRESGEWINRGEFPYPYQDYCPFDDTAIVEVGNDFGPNKIGPANSFWWGYAEGLEEETMITRARQLSKNKINPAA